jgi:2-polyprenyl-3-methyl-5-hydroxy-6-metoxy-1,4-benzoquinol methylase
MREVETSAFLGGLACRFCAAPLTERLADLGRSPLSNAYVRPGEPETLFPLVAFVCDRCLLVQVPAVVSPDRIFGDYAYMSSYSDSWLEHVSTYCTTMADRLGLGPGSRVVEVGSNDGHLLACFVKRGIPVLGVDPAANIAHVAREAGVATATEFFGLEVAQRLVASGGRADLLIGNNVLPHVPDLHDFVAGLETMLAPGGLLTLELPHLLQLMRGGQFDTIYHEHFSYFSVLTARQVLAAHRLQLIDVEELPTHGGSLRLYVRHESERAAVGGAVGRLIARERRAGLDSIETYRRFADGVRETRRSLVDFLAAARAGGSRVAGYGAPAKATTLLNYCGVGPDSIEYTVDRNPHKQGRLLPGTGIPIHPPERLAETQPEYVVILPWNLRAEIEPQLAHVGDWGGRLVVPVPRAEVLS